MVRLGLCCIFKKEPIKFKTTTVKYVSSLKNRKERKIFFKNLILQNCSSLLKALIFCKNHHIGSFRVNSRFFPLYTHPRYGYKLEDLPEVKDIYIWLKKIKNFSKENNIRLTMHPDQFVVLNSISKKVVKSSILEIKYHQLVASLINADVIIIHVGGVYGNKKEALKRLEKVLSSISKKYIALENDDKSYSPKDLLFFCKKNKIAFVYDVHHHRCLKDGLLEEDVTKMAIETWEKEPLFHLSSPLLGWKAKDIRKHSGYINIKDFPKCWYHLKENVTIEIEAKEKEVAILKLIKQLKLKKVKIIP